MRGRVRRQCYYDARVNDVNLRDITSSEKNANILRALRGEQPDNCCRKMVVTSRIDNDDAGRFSVRDGDDLGWLGYFLGGSDCLETLFIDSLVEDIERIDALMEGLGRNKSIRKIGILSNHLEDFGLLKLGDFFRRNENLSGVAFASNNIGNERAHDIASLVSQMRPNSMTNFILYNSTISNEGFSEICEALRSQPQIGYLSLKGADIGRNGYVTLGSMLSSWHAPRLKDLNLEDTSIDDGGLQALVEGMSNCRNLSALTLSCNRSITAAGLRSLSTLFQSENCSLEELCLESMSIGDDGATALVEGLRGNESLKQLRFNVDASEITEVGWSAFSNLLCDTSSINNTYLSNHTLQWIGANDHSGTPEDVKKYLDCNEVSVLLRNKQDVAILKILGHNIDPLEFSTESLFQFQWKLKFLP